MGGVVNEGDLREVTLGVRGELLQAGAPANTLFPHARTLCSHFHPTPNPICATFILIALMKVINISPLY